MDLALRDKILKQLLNEIKKNKKDIKTQYKELNKIENDNKFLENVKEDYEKYQTHIVDEKTRQKEFMSILLEYIQDLTKNLEMTKEMKQRALLSQNKILGQMDKVKQELDEIISNNS
jgi:septal ring factor EnvC (AmiA/AmiB activator)